MQKMKKMMILGLLILNLVFSISKKEKMKKLYMGFDWVHKLTNKYATEQWR